MLIYAVVPARSGSKGLPDKNIQPLAGRPLMAHSIAFAKALKVDRVICSTDSDAYADIAREYGAEVPFLRSAFASTDTAMEQDILRDFAEQFPAHGVPSPDLIVWLRPTFPFRDVSAVQRCVNVLLEEPSYSSARTVCESEARLYSLEDGLLLPDFDDDGKSMIRRQAVGKRYKVYSTDVLRYDPSNINDDFLGRRVFGVAVNKFCGLDIDDAEDFQIIEGIIKGAPELVRDYIF